MNFACVMRIHAAAYPLLSSFEIYISCNTPFVLLRELRMSPLQNEDYIKERYMELPRSGLLEQTDRNDT